ncbi:MAG: NADPH-dependent FMN reductase [Fluviicola sp.]|nr:MAG: NADPH-dependent FMN reductase [Fluviicola sp.]
MKIVGFAGSNSKKSINKQFVKYTLEQLKDHEIHLLDLNDFEIPMFGVDREEEKGYPNKVKEFIEIIQSADGLVVSLAEHNGAYTAVFKNLMDWCSRYELKFFNKIPMLLLSTSPGGYGGGNSMELGLSRLPKFDANIVANFSLPKFNDNFNNENGIKDDELRANYEAKLQEFKKELI